MSYPQQWQAGPEQIGDAQTHTQPHQAPPTAPVFQVTTMTHTGALVMFVNQRQVVTGTHEQCRAALRRAQIHNLTLGWWSFLSIMIMNWVAIAHNWNARSKLEDQAKQAQAYAQWWWQYYGPR